MLQRVPPFLRRLSFSSPSSSAVAAPVPEVPEPASALRPGPPRAHPPQAPGGPKSEDPLHRGAAGQPREEVQEQGLPHHRREDGLCPGARADRHPGQDLVPEQTRQGEEDR